MESASHIAWKKLVAAYCSDETVAGELLEELLKKYSGRGRYYHDWQHVETLLGLSAEYAAKLTNKDIVDFAIFYHDAIYNVLSQDNEQRSAAMAVERLTKLGVPSGIVHEVDNFIRATKSHRIPEGFAGDTDLQYFLDFDMSILGADRDAYCVYKENVRKEYRLIPAALYRPGRKKFLQRCLQSESIFQTAAFRAKYEAQARANLQWELERDYNP